MKHKKFLFIVFSLFLCFFILNFKNKFNHINAQALATNSYYQTISQNQIIKPKKHTNAPNLNIIDFSITLLYGNKTFHLNLNPLSKIHTTSDFKYKSTHKQNYKNVVKMLKKIRKMGFDDKVAFNYVFAQLKPQLEQIISSINTEPINATINFDKTLNSFITTKDINGTEVDLDNLYSNIIESLLQSNCAKVQIKTNEVTAKILRKDVEQLTKKQSTFSTYYGASNNERKNNIKIACNSLHGFRIEPGQIFSFNEAIGRRSLEAGYKEANIIKDGEFVKGVGGGVCQVSSTLYNALLLANIKPFEVHKHSLPVSYVKPALDAMVSWNTADLKFKNNTNLPIFITSSCNGSNLTFNIYGNTKEQNTQIKTVSQIIKTIPHKGDKIVPDTQGKYLNKIMFKGEYLREKSPKDGYIAHAYLDTYRNGELISHQLIREVMYEPQLGLVYEGTEELPEGMTLPDREN